MARKSAASATGEVLVPGRETVAEGYPKDHQVVSMSMSQ